MRNKKGDLVGLEAIIDKDKASSLLARNIGASTLIISTSVDEVYLNFGEKRQKAIRNVSLSKIKKYLKDNEMSLKRRDWRTAGIYRYKFSAIFILFVPTFNEVIKTTSASTWS